MCGGGDGGLLLVSGEVLFLSLGDSFNDIYFSLLSYTLFCFYVF